MAAPNKHLSETGHPASEAVLLGAFWVPKEDKKSIAAALITYFKYLDEKKVRLLRLVTSFLVDGHEGAKAAIQQARLRLKSISFTVRQYAPEKNTEAIINTTYSVDVETRVWNKCSFFLETWHFGCFQMNFQPGVPNSRGEAGPETCLGSSSTAAEQDLQPQQVRRVPERRDLLLVIPEYCGAVPSLLVRGSSADD